jgi:thiol:disulfide interchange protein
MAGPVPSSKEIAMKGLLLAGVLLIPTSLSWADKEQDPTKVFTFRSLSFDEAIKAARNGKQVVLVCFHATWCGPCKKMRSETYTDARVAGFLRTRAVAILVDVDTPPNQPGHELVKKFAIQAMPTMVFVHPDRGEIGRIVGYQSAERFLAEAERSSRK